MAKKTEIEYYEDDREEMASAGRKTRMIDWLQCCKLPVAFSVVGFLVLYGVTGDLRSGSKTLADLLPNTRADALVACLLPFNYPHLTSDLSEAPRAKS
ncbi:hypothetical protein G6321_00045940 [Bradyrhizobium barranii subsp. barranii]|uniref:Uncharacterized protein n=1 Tax=Bradyrhizobium barranii subsp. barranii TaxID=2823807 RepID=A0A7Z0TT23_9BRAD|nr:hypothetical protein [Bradyrhizobium barranii]UGX92897.1 hypothetical protein G6321_00045940 [Bradyrhizobium barranii subsp. barranii]